MRIIFALAKADNSGLLVAKMWGIVAQKGEREGGKKERKGEKERKRVELVILMPVPSFFEILRTLA